MPDNDTLDFPDELLAYRADPPANDFVAGVMQRTGQQRRTRRLVLWGTGLAGTVCGVIGAASLSGPISQGMTAAFETPASTATALLATATAVLVAWFMAEDQSIFG